MQSLEAACEEAEHIFRKAKTNPASFSRPQEPLSTFCIHSKLREIYEELSVDGQEELQGLKVNSLLLEKLVSRDKLNTLIFNLYPGNKGFSLTFSLSEEDTMIETKQWPYEEDELLRCLDHEEMPSMLLDLLEPHCCHLYYSNCIIAEVRDYRQAYPHLKCDVHHVLLRPTPQSILKDINLMMEKKADWGVEEKLALESQLILITNPKLCLSPSASVGLIQNRLQHQKQPLNVSSLRKCARKSSQVHVNRKRKLDKLTHRPGLELHEYITRLRDKPKTKRLGEIIPAPSLEPAVLPAPLTPVSVNEFRAYARPKETNDCLPQLIEEFILETDMPSKGGMPRVYHIRLSILQRPSNSEYLGELYLDRDYKNDKHNGASCRFSLGTRSYANKYIRQFTEIFTERGCKSVSITHKVPGQKPATTITPGMTMQFGAQQAPSNSAQFQANNAAKSASSANNNTVNNNNTAIISLLNSTPATIGRKVALSNTRVLNHITALSTEGNKSALSALLVDTPAADVPIPVLPGGSTNSVLLEKLAASSPKAAVVPTSTINVQSLALAGLQVQFQPVVSNNTALPIAQLVASGVKGLSQQGLRAAGPAGVSLSQAGQSLQLMGTRGLTFKMSTPNTNAQRPVTTMQKQAQIQQLLRRRSTDPNK